MIKSRSPWIEEQDLELSSYDALRSWLKGRVIVCVAVCRRGSSRCNGNLSNSLLGSGRWLVIIFEVELRRQRYEVVNQLDALFRVALKDPNIAVGPSFIPCNPLPTCLAASVPSVER